MLQNKHNKMIQEVPLSLEMKIRLSEQPVSEFCFLMLSRNQEN